MKFKLRYLIPILLSAIMYGQAPTWISNVVSSPAATTADIYWYTAVPATSRLKWGKNTNYGSNNVMDPSLLIPHHMIIGKLAPLTTYHYRIMSQDALGVLVTSLDFNFTTGAHAVLLQWPASPTFNVTYNVYKAGSALGPWSLTGRSQTTTYTDTTVQGGQSLYYMIKSYDGISESIPSGTVQVLIPSP